MNKPNKMRKPVTPDPTLVEHINKLIAQYGSLHQVSKRLGVSYSQLRRIHNGKSVPGAGSLLGLGLQRVITITYEPLSFDR